MNYVSAVAAYVRSLSYGKKISMLSVLVLAIILPAVLLVVSQQENITSKADTSTTTEAETGTISGNAVLKSSEMASGGKYILLNASASTQPPTPTTYKAPTPIPTKWPPTPTPRPFATSTPWPTQRPLPTSAPRPTSTPIPMPGHGNGNGPGDHH